MTTNRQRFLILIAFLFLLSLIVGCSSAYKLPESVSNPAVIMGDLLRTDESQDWRIILFFDVKNVETPADATRYYTSENYSVPPGKAEKYAQLPLKIKPGKHTLKIQRIRRLSNSSATDWDVLPPIELDLLEGRSFQLTGEMIVGSTFKYWIDDINTGERVTDVYYDPDGLKEILSRISHKGHSSEGYAQLLTNQERVFASKIRLHHGRDCFNLIGETIIDVEKVVLGAMFAFLSFGKAGFYPGESGYQVYEDICIDVKEGHKYELKHRLEPGEPCIEGVDLGYEEGDECWRKEKWYELWDTTDDQRLIEFKIEDLDVILDGVE